MQQIHFGCTRQTSTRRVQEREQDERKGRGHMPTFSFSTASVIMLRFRHASRSLASSSARAYYASQTPNVPVKFIAELRKHTTVSMTKAREALAASDNDVAAALAWLAKDLAILGANKAAKLADRTAKEGLISLALVHANGTTRDPGVRAALIELNCETDFVARNELFGQLADDVAHTVAFHAEQDPSGNFFRPGVIEALLEAPLMPATQPQSPSSGSYATIGSAIRDSVAKLGENISLRRAASVVAPPPPPTSDMRLRLANYIHNPASKPTQGRIAGLALLALKGPGLSSHFGTDTAAGFVSDLERIERAVTRQLVGYETTSIEGTEETALYAQPFDMFPEAAGASVRDALTRWAKEKNITDSDEGGIAVLEYAKWAVGEAV
jgi:elongation factor Ts